MIEPNNQLKITKSNPKMATLQKKFETIHNFVSDLNENFGKDHRSLERYYVFLDKTRTENRTDLKKKHVSVFEGWIKQNREAILNKDSEKFRSQISYTPKKIYIPIRKIFTESEDSESLWKHLLYLSALLDPESGARRILESTNDTFHGAPHGPPQTPNIANLAQMMSTLNTGDGNLGMAGIGGLAASLLGNATSGMPDGAEKAEFQNIFQTMIGEVASIASDPSKLRDTKQITALFKKILPAEARRKGGTIHKFIEEIMEDALVDDDSEQKEESPSAQVVSINVEEFSAGGNKIEKISEEDHDNDDEESELEDESWVV